MTKTLDELAVKIFADGATLEGMLELYGNRHIAGFTTNPTLMRRSGISDYEKFAHQVLERISDRPISFEVFSDDIEEMLRQAHKIAAWGDNVFVKVPVINTRGESCESAIRSLASEGIRLNVTAVMTPRQVEVVSPALGPNPASYVSIFAGRIADTGQEPAPLMKEALDIMADYPNQKLIWASPRELLNIFHADAIGCHVITVTYDILRKLPLIGRDLNAVSLETVQMFHSDARSAGFQL